VFFKNESEQLLYMKRSLGIVSKLLSGKIITNTENYILPIYRLNDACKI